jgi:sugar (pentulose or hexulose) kinase
MPGESPSGGRQSSLLNPPRPSAESAEMGGIYLMGIDAGTSMVKCTIFDAGGAERFGASRRLPVVRPGPDLAEQDMNTVYEAVLAVMAHTCAKAGTIRR